MEHRNETNVGEGSEFVRFKSRSTSTPIIPEHLRAAMIPKSLLSNSCATARMKVEEHPEKKSSAAIRQEIKILNAEREQRLHTLLEKQKKRKEESDASSLAPSMKAPPPITFGIAKRRRKK
jgi:hypothetical protein